MDSDHSANTDQTHRTSTVSTRTLITGEGFFRPGRLRAFALLPLHLSGLLDPSSVSQDSQPELAGALLRDR